MLSRHLLLLHVFSFFFYFYFFAKKKRSKFMSTICMQSDLEICHGFLTTLFILWYTIYRISFRICMFWFMCSLVFIHHIWPFVLLMLSHISACNIIYVGLLVFRFYLPSISTVDLPFMLPPVWITSRFFVNRNNSCPHKHTHELPFATINCINVN